MMITPRLAADATKEPFLILFSVARSRDVRHSGAPHDRLAADLLGLRLLLHQFQHLEDVVAGNEADARIVGDHEIAGLDPDLADLDRAVDLDGFDPPLA